MQKIGVLIMATMLVSSMVTLVNVGLTSVRVVADDNSVDEINITTPVVCTLGGTGMDTHNATIDNRQYNSAIGESTIKAFCNDNNGFSIYAIGYTDNTDGKNVLTNSVLGSTHDIVTGTATSGTTSNWAMKLFTVTNPAPTYPIIIAGSANDTDKTQGDPDFTSFQEVPDDYVKVAYRKAGTDINPTGQSMAEGSILKSTYQAYVSPTQPAGTYTGQVKYTIVHPYNAEKPLLCNPSGTTIGTNTSTDIVCMQDISATNKSSILTSMTAEQQYTLTDKRDEKTYTVSKLADGNIWMTQNLDLDLDSSKTYTNKDTDLGWNGTSYDTASWSPNLSTYTTGTTTWNDSNYTPESYDPGELYWNGTAGYYGSETDCTNAGGTWNNTNGACNFISSTGNSHYHLGNYYNWTAAIASNDSSSITSGTVEQSICPAGWTLPIGGRFDSNAPSKSFQYLVEQYGWDNGSYELGNNRKTWDSPFYLGLSGYWYGMLWNVGDFVDLWSSVASDEGAYVLGTDLYGVVGPDFGGNRDDGRVVRCVVR